MITLVDGWCITAAPVTMEASQKGDERSVARPDLLIIPKKQGEIVGSRPFGTIITENVKSFPRQGLSGVMVWSRLTPGHNGRKHGGKQPTVMQRTAATESSPASEPQPSAEVMLRDIWAVHSAEVIHRSKRRKQTHLDLMGFGWAEGSDMTTFMSTRRHQKHHVCQSAALITSPSDDATGSRWDRQPAELYWQKKAGEMSQFCNDECSLPGGMRCYTPVSHLEHSYSQSHFPETTCDCTNLGVQKVSPLLLRSYSAASIKIRSL